MTKAEIIAAVLLSLLQVAPFWLFVVMGWRPGQRKRKKKGKYER